MRKFLMITGAGVALLGINAFAGSGESLTQGVDFNRAAVLSADAAAANAARSQCAQNVGAVNQIIYFEFNKTQSTETMNTLQNIANLCSSDAGCSNMSLIGHTDTVGATSLNQVLSVRRANRVKRELVKLGMPSGSISTFGLGESELFIPTSDGVKEQLNRRVEVCYNQIGAVTYQEPVYSEPVYSEPVYVEPTPVPEAVYVEPTPVPEAVYVEPAPVAQAPRPYVQPAPTPAPAPVPAPTPAPVVAAGGAGISSGLLVLGAIGAAGLAAVLLDKDDTTPISP